MIQLRNIELSFIYLKLAVFASLLAVSVLYGLGLDSILHDNCEKTYLLVDTDSFDAEEKEMDDDSTISIDVNFFGCLASSNEAPLLQKNLSFNACFFTNHLPSFPKYLLYHQLKLDC